MLVFQACLIGLCVVRLDACGCVLTSLWLCVEVWIGLWLSVNRSVVVHLQVYGCVLTGLWLSVDRSGCPLTGLWLCVDRSVTVC